VSYVDRLFGLRDKVAIVTGASRGIGAALALALARSGARVIGVSRSVAPDEALDGVEYQSCDVTDESAFTRVCAAEGRLDVLVNAAGITLPSDYAGGPLAAFDQTLAINLRAAYTCCLAASAKMTEGGSIVNVTSIGSLRGFPGNPAYVAAKGGLRSLTQALAVDLGPSGIRVNNLAPGYVRTAMTASAYADQKRRAQRERHTTLGRWARPDDLVGAVVFLASDAAAYVTGQDLIVDGGWTVKGLT
jgi:NAD(P)-dependent dehydrogenase (short-subunit alcohol dehydrogenase family)